VTADAAAPLPADAAVPQPPDGSGAEFQIRDVLELIKQGQLQPPPAAVLLGLRIVAVEPGRAVFALPLAAEHTNYAGTVNGGVIATLVDFAVCSALNDLPVTSAVATASLAVTYQAPVHLTAGEIQATAVIAHRTSRTATAEATVTGPDGTRYATALATVVARPMPA
jgi:uncharacterized protein (TIGR00369 family)